jgi:hypothetical protein
MASQPSEDKLPELTEAQRLELEEQGYFMINQCLRTGKVYALQKFIYTVAIVCEIALDGCYEYRYCYKSEDDAVPAFRDWIARGFEEEPNRYIKRKPEVRK